MRVVIGYHEFADRYVLYPKLPESWAGGTVRIRNAKKTHTFYLTLKENNQIECRIVSPAGQIVNTTIENYSFRNFTLPLEEPAAAPEAPPAER